MQPLFLKSLQGMLKKVTSSVLALLPCSRTKSTLRASKELRPCWTDFFEHSFLLMMRGSSGAVICSWSEIFNSPLQACRLTATAISLFLLTNSCAWTPQVRTSVYEGTEGSVSFITESDTNFHPSHPADLPLPTIDRVLRGLYIQQGTGLLQGLLSNKPSRQRVFSDEQITWLAPFLQQGFTQVTAEEKVSFQVNPSTQNDWGPIQGTMYHDENSLVISIEGRTNRPRISSKQNPGSSSGLPAGVYAERLGFSPERAVKKVTPPSWLKGGSDPNRVVIDYSMIDGKQQVPSRPSDSEEGLAQSGSSNSMATKPLPKEPGSSSDPTHSILPASPTQSNDHDLLREIHELKKKLEAQQAEIEALKERN